MRIMIPLNLSPYIRLRDGEIVLKKDLPADMEAEFQQFKTKFEKIIANKAEEAKRNIYDK